jgi:DeoR/GlpR family transcriptional regulator of sugar metabolism
VAFPEPRRGSRTVQGLRVVDLKTLIELKLASGMTARDRLQDLADVQRLIRVHGLKAGFSTRLNPYVREKFRELAGGTYTET